MIDFKIFNLSALAEVCEVNPRTLRAAVKHYYDTGVITPTLDIVIKRIRMEYDTFLKTSIGK